MKEQKIAPFPSRRQSDGIRWPAFVVITAAMCVALQHIDRDQDQYGRDLRIITRDGQSLGDTLVAEGLAERWQGYRRDWC